MKATPEDVLQAIYDAAEKGLRVVVVAGSGGGGGGPIELGPTSLAALEEIQVSVTGEGGISTETTLAAALAMLTPGTPEQHVGSVGVATHTVTFSGPTKHVVIQNPEVAGTLEISLDGGASFMPIPARGQVSLPCRVASLQIRSGSGSADYAIIATT